MSRYSKLNQRGFTLLELMLAMSLFLTVLVLTTSGFIALNRTYTRGTVRRQLSEAVQRGTEQITQAVRAAPANSSAVTNCATASPSCVPTGMNNALSFNTNCFFWNNSSDPSLRGGLYVSDAKCQSGNASKANARTLADTRYLVQSLTVSQMAGENGLWRISGVIRTVDDNNFLNVGQPTVRCKGTSQSAFTQVCAAEQFSFIVNARGSTSL